MRLGLRYPGRNVDFIVLRVQSDLAALNGGIMQRAAGHYVLASYRIGRHLQPVVKWEQVHAGNELVGQMIVIF